MPQNTMLVMHICPLISMTLCKNIQYSDVFVIVSFHHGVTPLTGLPSAASVLGSVLNLI